jgi:hypothetical protein
VSNISLVASACLYSVAFPSGKAAEARLTLQGWLANRHFQLQAETNPGPPVPGIIPSSAAVSDER